METKTIYRSVKCELTDGEKQELGVKMADALAELDEIEDTLENAKKQAKADSTRCEGIISSCKERIRSGYEFRNVECEVRKNRATKLVLVIRKDTYEVIEQRPMSMEELQALPIEEGGPDSDAPEPYVTERTTTYQDV